jgi:hypothetical protein
MSNIPFELINEIDELLGVKGQPYRRFVDGNWEKTDCFLWSERENLMEIIESISPELREVMTLSKATLAQKVRFSSDYVNQMRKHITKEFPHLLEEYELYLTRSKTAEDRILYPSRREPPSLPEEIRETAERIADQVSAKINWNKFDMDEYIKLSQELWQLETNEEQEILRQFSEEFLAYQDSLQEAKRIKEDRLAAVRDHLQGKPYLAYGDVKVAPTDDQFDILRIEETNGGNYDLHTADIINSLKLIDKQFNIDILDAGFDFVKFRLNQIPTNKELEGFVNNLHKLCPDFEENEEELKHGTVYMWWD